jgi:hypothetical protein
MKYISLTIGLIFLELWFNYFDEEDKRQWMMHMGSENLIRRQNCGWGSEYFLHLN